MKFIREHGVRRTPFFAYLPHTPPHGNFDIPDSDPAWAIHNDRPWPENARTDRHDRDRDRDRRTKTGQQDNLHAPDPLAPRK